VTVADDANVVSSLQREIDRLNQRVTQLQGEATRRKDTVQQICTALGVSNNAELKATVAQLRERGGFAKLTKDLDAARTAASPTELQTKLDQAVTELRSIKHRDGLQALYEDPELGLNKAVPVERLKTILGYAPASDDFDAAAVKAAISDLKAKGTDPYLFAPDQSSTVQPQSQAQPLWGGRGSPGQSVAGPQYTDAQLRDPVFMYAAQQQAIAAQAGK
jgi:transposase-like protein